MSGTLPVSWASWCFGVLLDGIAMGGRAVDSVFSSTFEGSSDTQAVFVSRL
jgi:hypothetical protein